MPQNVESFVREKERRLSQLREEVARGLVDEEVVPVLELINRSFKYCYTTSSCSGRIVIIEAPEPGDKPGARLLGKWHRKVSGKEVAEALKQARSRMLVWASAQGPLLHVACMDFESASTILRTGHLAGFKHSCIHVAYGGRWVVELRSAERIDIPIYFQGKRVVDDPLLIAEVLNYYLGLGKSRIPRLLRALAVVLSGAADQK